MKNLITSAQKVLDMNWRDGFTIPTNNLYPFQWNWDSGFVSMGLSSYNVDKAIKEMESLFSGQWENGMIPHIIFHSENETTYFPNFDFWESEVNLGAPNKPKSSGITQPAVHGFVLEKLLKDHPGNPKVLGFAKAIFPKVLKYHQFLYEKRDPNKEGLMFIYHPWESGRDNSPLWDESLKRIKIDAKTLPKYARRDITIADASERPTNSQYDCYVYLLQLGKLNKYDGSAIAEESPFLIQDTLMNAVLIKSNESLINIADQLGFDKGQLQEWQTQSKKAFNQKLWNESLQTYTSFDLRGNKPIALKEIGGIATLFAGIPSEKQANAISGYLQSLHDRGFFLCPSFDVEHPLFDSKRYWRGPIWPQMNWMIHHGLKKYGKDDLAKIVKSDILELIETLGFYEYFESQKSVVKTITKGYGGDQFSWTASTAIDLMQHS